MFGTDQSGAASPALRVNRASPLRRSRPYLEQTALTSPSVRFRYAADTNASLSKRCRYMGSSFGKCSRINVR